jgi:hypothetical protein
LRTRDDWDERKYKERTPSDIDEISFAPTLLGRTQPEGPFLYREAPDYGGQQSVRVGNWKAIRTNLHPPPAATNQAPGAIELYDLASDPTESRDVASILRSSRDSRRFYESNTCPRRCGRFGRWTRRHLGGDFLTAAPNRGRLLIFHPEKDLSPCLSLPTPSVLHNSTGERS